jgi:murein L,D-transpeptidase YcbB/YkuD
MRAGMRASILALTLLLTAPPALSTPAGDPDWHIPLALADAGPPDAPDAVRLRAALSHYETLAAAGGWPVLPAGTQPLPGERDQRVVELRERLRISGDFEGLPGTADAWFLTRACNAPCQVPGTPRPARQWRSRPANAHGTKHSVENRIAQLQATLARWNWLRAT